MFHDIPMSVLKSTGFRQKLSNGSETQMEEEDALAVGYEVFSIVLNPSFQHNTLDYTNLSIGW